MIKAILKSTARISLVFIIGILACVYFLGNTSAGLRVSLNLLAIYSKAQLHVGQAEGKLFSGFTLHDVNYHSGDAELTINSLSLAWNLKFLPDHLIIEKLQAKDFIFKLHPSTTSSTDIDYLAYLKRLTIKDLSLENFTFINGAQAPFQFAEVNLQKTDANHLIFLAKTLGGEVNGNIQLKFGRHTDWAVMLTGQHINPSLHWQEWPGDVTFALKSQGSFTTKRGHDALSFQLMNLSGNLRGYPLNGHIDVSLLDNKFLIKEGELTNGKAKINFNGALTDNWNINWNIEFPDLAMLFPHSLGSFTSQGSLRGPRDEPSVIANFQAVQMAFANHSIKHLDGKIHFTVKPGTLFGLSVNGSGLRINGYKLAKLDLDVSGQTHLQQDDLVMAFTVALAKKPYIDGQVILPTSMNSDNYLTTPIKAQLTMNFSDLTMFKNYIPHVHSLAGNITGKLNVAGELNKPLITGEAILKNGEVGIPKLGITLQHVNLRLTSDNTKRTYYQGNFQLGSGTATLAGSTDFNSADFATELQLKGSNLQVVNLPEYKINANPNLYLHFKNFKLAIDGDIAIPEAKITPKDFRQTVTLPEEIVFVGNKVPHTVGARTTLPALQITLQLQNHILLNYQDLKTTLGGVLTIHATPETPATAVGSLYTLGGTYRACAQTLNIQEGRLTYTGGVLTNPGLNIKASMPSSGTQSYLNSGAAGFSIRIAGTLNKPEISTSNANSAVGLGCDGTGQLATMTKKFQEGLGLTEMNVETVQTFNPNAGQTVEAKSLVVGKAISKKLYAHYSVSLFNATPVSVFNLRYIFNKHWSVQTETSTIDNGADLLYTIEQN